MLHVPATREGSGLMLAMVQSCAVVGLDRALVQVEVDPANGLPAFTIVGLPDAAVNEAEERVRTAISNSGLGFPNGGAHSRVPCRCCLPMSDDEVRHERR